MSGWHLAAWHLLRCSVQKAHIGNSDDLRDGGAAALSVLGPVPEDGLDPVAVDPLPHVHLAQVDRVLVVLALGVVNGRIRSQIRIMNPFWPILRVAIDHDRDQIFGLDCQQQLIPIYFWLNQPQELDLEVV